MRWRQAAIIFFFPVRIFIYLCISISISIYLNLSISIFIYLYICLSKYLSIFLIAAYVYFFLSCVFLPPLNKELQTLATSQAVLILQFRCCNFLFLGCCTPPPPTHTLLSVYYYFFVHPFIILFY